ncbi:hypothetical protein AMS68_001174 [Peltaster fructicola]|uniref:Uncharacterized protein n=1 Tax=Peltaster fructicola TaxID=286661 RepID=A0A6H0XLM5_9PEZI|nr:hypothetical protein AMS68_001174 [Peltaster fructicola]
MDTSQIVKYVLAAEFALGGQARLTSALTPAINRFVIDKSDGFFQNLSFVPGRGARQKTHSLGAVMCTAAALLAIPQHKVSATFRRATVLLAGSLSTILLVGESGIGGDVWLPAINILLAGWLIYNQTD